MIESAELRPQSFELPDFMLTPPYLSDFAALSRCSDLDDRQDYAPLCHQTEVSSRLVHGKFNCETPNAFLCFARATPVCL